MRNLLKSLLCCIAFTSAYGAEETNKSCKPAEKAAENSSPNSNFKYDADSNILKIEFFTAEMVKTQPEEAALHQASDCFSFDNAFALPEDMWKALGASHPLVIEKGSYPIIHSPNSYTVVIQF